MKLRIYGVGVVEMGNFYLFKEHDKGI